MKISQLSDQSAMTLRMHVPMSALPTVIGEAYGKIAAYIDQAGLQTCSYPYVVYHNMDMNDLDVEMGIPVEASLPGDGEVRAGVLNGGPAATCLYTGPYSGLAETYLAMDEWVETQKLELAGTAYEIYYNDPVVTPPEELRTLIAYPLKSA
jgi:effector-binding domain-containing protein